MFYNSLRANINKLTSVQGMLILIRLITNKFEICLLKPFCCFGIWDLIWDLEFEDFWCEIRFKIWDLAWIFESPVKKIWDFRVRFDLWFTHHCCIVNEPLFTGSMVATQHCYWQQLKSMGSVEFWHILHNRNPSINCGKKWVQLIRSMGFNSTCQI